MRQQKTVQAGCLATTKRHFMGQFLRKDGQMHSLVVYVHTIQDKLPKQLTPEQQRKLFKERLYF